MLRNLGGVESFVVRLWVPGDAGPPALRGVVQHVASGQSAVFGGSDGLLAFLMARVTDAADSAREDDDG